MQSPMLNVVRILVAFVLAACVCYVLAIVFATTANLLRLAGIGADITVMDALRTYLFDLYGMAPALQWTRYGTVILIGLAIAFPVAAGLRWLVMRASPEHAILAWLYPAAGATAIGTSLVLMYQTYEVSAIAGGRGMGFSAQCLAGAIAGLVFHWMMSKESLLHSLQHVFARGAASLVLCVVLSLLATQSDGRELGRELQLEVLVEDLDAPWGLALLPDGRMLVTERTGAMYIHSASGVRLAKIANVPASFVKLQGGLLDVELHPRFEQNSLIYLSLAHGEQKRNTTRVVRARLSGEALADVEIIFDTTPKGTSVHYGGRLAFLRDGTLLVTTGEGAEYREDAQRMDSLLGKVVRITDTGAMPRDNPFVQRAGAHGAIWSFGHRNPQGLYVDPRTNSVYLTEHGPRGGDELNIIEPAVNYGWPIATHGIDYTGGRISPFETYRGMREPLVYWTPSIGPGGVIVYRGELFPEWEGDVLVGALAHRHLRRIEMENGRVVAQHVLLPEYDARFRQLELGPRGEIYALIDSIGGADQSGQLVKITPAAAAVSASTSHPAADDR